MAKFYFAIIVLLCVSNSYAQDEPFVDRMLNAPTKFLDAISKRSARVEDDVIKQTERALDKFEKEERKLQRKVAKKDSARAAIMFAESQQRIQNFRNRLNNPGAVVKSSKYSPYIDSLTTSLHFIEKIPSTNSKEVQDALGKVKGMENAFSQAEDVKSYVRKRREYLKNQLGQLGLTKELMGYNKKAYYYAAELKNCRETMRDPDAIVKKTLSVLSKTKVFQNFFQKYSVFGSIFQSGSGGAPGVVLPADPALQTTNQVCSSIQQVFNNGSANGNPLQGLQSAMNNAGSQIQGLKNKVNLTGGSSSDEQPEFKPNSQKTKSFLNRIEVGTTLQNVPSTYFLPRATQFGFSLGYKINDNSVIGIGGASMATYEGNFKKLIVRYQGITLQSFLDYHLKKSFWLSGGFEMQHVQAITQIDSLKDMSAWIPKGLLGLSKKYQISKKFKGKVSILWNFLNEGRSKMPIEFRSTYSLN